MACAYCGEPMALGRATCGDSFCQQADAMEFKMQKVKSKETLREAVGWIAMNDNPGNGDGLRDITGYISVLLVADLWRVPSGVVARLVIAVRNLNSISVGRA